MRLIKVGSAGAPTRDYSNLAALAADIGTANLASGPDTDTPPQAWVIELYQDSGSPADIVLTGTFTVPGTDNHSITLRAASGTGAGGQPNRHDENRGASDPLDIDNTKGVVLSMSAGFAPMISANHGFVMEGLQLRATGNRGRPLDTMRGGVIRDCILETTHSAPGAVVIGNAFGADSDLTIENSLLITSANESTRCLDLVAFDTNTITLRGVAAINTHATKTASQLRISGGSQTVNIYGCASVGHALGFVVAGTLNLVADGNAADLGTIPGTNPVSIATTDFENVTATSVTDARPTAASPLVGGVALANMPATDMVGTTRASPATIGPWEILAGGGGTFEETLTAAVSAGAGVAAGAVAGAGLLIATSAAAGPAALAEIQATVTAGGVATVGLLGGQTVQAALALAMTTSETVAVNLSFDAAVLAAAVAGTLASGQAAADAGVLVALQAGLAAVGQAAAAAGLTFDLSAGVAIVGGIVTVGFVTPASRSVTVVVRDGRAVTVKG